MTRRETLEAAIGEFLAEWEAKKENLAPALKAMDDDEFLDRCDEVEVVTKRVIELARTLGRDDVVEMLEEGLAVYEAELLSRVTFA